MITLPMTPQMFSNLNAQGQISMGIGQPQIGGSYSSSKSAKGGFDPLKAILEMPSQLLGQMLSQDLLQAKQMGIPTDNLIGTLLSMSPMKSSADLGVSAGMSMAGGGNQPPGGPQPPNMPKPPNGPGGIPAQDDQTQPQTVQETPNSLTGAFLAGSGQPQQTQSQGGGFNPQANLTGIPTAQEIASRFMSPQAPQQRGKGLFSPNRINEQGQYETGGLFGTLLGLNSDQAARLMTAGSNMNANKAQEAAIKAAITPATQAERMTAEATTGKYLAERYDKAYEKLLEPLSGAKELSQVESAITSLDNIKSILGISVDTKSGRAMIKNPRILKDKSWMSKNRQSLLRARDLFINKVLRRDSGATITPADEKAAAKSIGFDVGFSSWMQNPELIAKSIVETQDQLLRDRTNLSPNSSVRRFVQEAKAKGATDAQIKKFLAEKGDLG